MKAINLLTASASLLLGGTAFAAPPMPPQQQQFCQLFSDIFKEEANQTSAPPENPIDAARHGPKPFPGKQLYPALVKLLGSSGRVEGWSGTLNGLGVVTEPTGTRADTRQVIRTQIDFTCPETNISQPFNLEVHESSFNGYNRPSGWGKNFGLIALDSQVATDLSKLANQGHEPPSVSFSGNLALVKQDLEQMSPTTFVFNLVSIKSGQ